jgi:hypothetical protein
MPPAKRWLWRSTTMPSAMETGRSSSSASTPGRVEALASEALGVADDVAEHGAGLHRDELLGVADQHQAGRRADRLEQAGHERQRHHRGLVDDDHLVGELVGCGRGGTGCGCPGSTRAGGGGWSFGRRRRQDGVADGGRHVELGGLVRAPPRCRRAAALPVGAASATRRVRPSAAACSWSRASTGRPWWSCPCRVRRR